MALNLGVGALVVFLLPRLRSHPLPSVRYLGLGLPLLALYLYYRGLGTALAAPGVVWHDAVFLRLEHALWTSSPSVPGWLRLWLAIAYHAYVPLLLGAMAAAFGPGDRVGYQRMQRVVRAVGLSWAACFLIFLLWPVMGPRLVDPGLQGARMGSGSLARFAAFYQQKGMLLGAAFPSAHVAGTVAAVAPLWCWRRAIFWGLAPVALSLAAGAVYFGYHYLADVVAGAALGAAAWVTLGLARRNGEPRSAAGGPEGAAPAR